jgi:hypothetical protein
MAATLQCQAHGVRMRHIAGERLGDGGRSSDKKKGRSPRLIWTFRP